MHPLQQRDQRWSSRRKTQDKKKRLTMSDAAGVVSMVVFMCVLLATVALIGVMQHHERQRSLDWRQGMTFVALVHGALLVCGLALFMGWSVGARRSV